MITPEATRGTWRTAALVAAVLWPLFAFTTGCQAPIDVNPWSPAPTDYALREVEKDGRATYKVELTGNVERPVWLGKTQAGHREGAFLWLLDATGRALVDPDVAPADSSMTAGLWGDLCIEKDEFINQADGIAAVYLDRRFFESLSKSELREWAFGVVPDQPLPSFGTRRVSPYRTDPLWTRSQPFQGDCTAQALDDLHLDSARLVASARAAAVKNYCQWCWNDERLAELAEPWIETRAFVIEDHGGEHAQHQVWVKLIPDEAKIERELLGAGYPRWYIEEHPWDQADLQAISCDADLLVAVNTALHHILRQLCSRGHYLDISPTCTQKDLDERMNRLSAGWGELLRFLATTELDDGGEYAFIRKAQFDERLGRWSAPLGDLISGLGTGDERLALDVSWAPLPRENEYGVLLRLSAGGE